MGLGEKLSLLRKQRGMTQMELAEALDISRQAVSRWEQGVSEPSTANLIRLGQLFGVPVDALVNGDAQSPPEADVQAEEASPEEAGPEEAPPNEAEDPPLVISPKPRRWPVAAVCAGVVCALLIGIAALLEDHSLKQRLDPKEQVGREEVDQSLITEPDIRQPLQPQGHSDLLRPGRVFIDASASCTSSKPFHFSDTCRPEDGKSLSIRIENTGNTDFDIGFSRNGKLVTQDCLVGSGNSIYTRDVDGITGCSFGIQITPRRSGETANFGITIYQG